MTIIEALKESRKSGRSYYRDVGAEGVGWNGWIKCSTTPNRPSRLQRPAGKATLARSAAPEDRKGETR